MIQMVDNIMNSENDIKENKEQTNNEEIKKEELNNNVKASDLITGINNVEKRAEKLGDNIQDIKKRINEMQELLKYRTEDNNFDSQNNAEDNMDILTDFNEDENLNKGEYDGE